MAKGYEFELADGSVLQLVPNKGVERCQIAYGNTCIDFHVESRTFHVKAPPNAATALASPVVRFEAKEINLDAKAQVESDTENPHILRTCTVCNGRSCCVTGGCGSCGCGLFCDN